MKTKSIAARWSSLDTTVKAVLGLTLLFFLIKTLARRFG